MKTYEVGSEIGYRTVRANSIKHAVELFAIAEVEDHEIMKAGLEYVVTGKLNGSTVELTVDVQFSTRP